MVQPDRPAVRRRDQDRSVGAQRDQARRLVVREPEFDVLLVLREPGEAERLRRARQAFRRPRGHVDGERVPAGGGGPAREAAVHEELVHPVGPRRRPDVDPLGGHHVQLHGGGPGAERQPDPGGLRLGHGELAVRDLPPGRCGQPVRQDPAPGALQVEGAPQDAGGDRGGGPAVGGAHVLGLFVLREGDTGCARGQEGAGQFRSRESSASRISVQLSWEPGELWLKPPAPSNST